MSLAVIRKDGAYVGALSSFDDRLVQLIRELLEKHDPDYTVQIQPSPGDHQKRGNR